MNEQKKLELQMFILFIIVFIFFGTITLTIKLGGVMTPKIEKKINSYIEDKYKNIKNEINIGKAKYVEKDYLYKIKVTNKSNKHLYFYVTYKNKKITSTYKKDYLEGNSLYTYYKKELEKNISKDYESVNIKFIKKLNKYTTVNKEKILTKNIKELPIYNVTVETSIKNWNQTKLTNELIKYKNYLEEEKYSPNSYNIIISNDKDIKKCLKINNLTNKLTENDLKLIINGIIKEDKNIMNEYNISYQYTK